MALTYIIYFLIFTIPLWGYLILLNTRVSPTLCGWLMAIGFIGLKYFFVPANPLTAMFLYIVSTFWSMKLVVTNNHLGKANRLTFIQWLVFSYGWFGMNPAPFKSFPGKPFPDYMAHILKGISRIIMGLVLITSARLYYFNTEWSVANNYFVNICYLISLSLILHFGILNINTGLLRMAGVNVSTLFNKPIKSKTLQEFWSRRWNLAFIELTTIAVLRPLKKRYGQKVAFWTSYIFSGLLHELAISLPVNHGYGKPFLYFIIQAGLILGVEKYVINPDTGKFKRLLWLLLCLFVPMPILFHQMFISWIVMPLVDLLAYRGFDFVVIIFE
ncbi:MBOAT family protein [Emticicia sp. BO119]|uniref:MBOAT family protein n=1 Tax=Emticicia sp. BO119 TaxID=2757768 RepID=UPI0015F0744C|nr:MBOAT family protein [Emticicia sp. BO119]MBA4848818.1 hypothetical protein [Emticicia sp. BO119]